MFQKLEKIQKIKKIKKKIDSKINDLINILKTELKENISNVIISERLTRAQYSCCRRNRYGH